MLFFSSQLIHGQAALIAECMSRMKKPFVQFKGKDVKKKTRNRLNETDMMRPAAWSVVERGNRRKAGA